MQKGESIHAELLWHWLADFLPEMYKKMHTRETHSKIQCSQNRPINPPPVSLSALWLDCIIKCVSAEGLGLEAQGAIAKITVYLNGLPLSGTVRMCNHKEISVPNELAGLSKQKSSSGSLILQLVRSPGAAGFTAKRYFYFLMTAAFCCSRTLLWSQQSRNGPFNLCTLVIMQIYNK